MISNEMIIYSYSMQYAVLKDVSQSLQEANQEIASTNLNQIAILLKLSFHEKACQVVRRGEHLFTSQVQLRHASIRTLVGSCLRSGAC